MIKWTWCFIPIFIAKYQNSKMIANIVLLFLVQYLYWPATWWVTLLYIGAINLLKHSIYIVDIKYITPCFTIVHTFTAQSFLYFVKKISLWLLVYCIIVQYFGMSNIWTCVVNAVSFKKKPRRLCLLQHRIDKHLFRYILHSQSKVNMLIQAVNTSLLAASYF